ncbi:MAG: hypothetical protein OEM38_01290 [Gammaproteobacteria bacterium]|nr:hypothetical protein [Gammaproteobacteria bacterium]
MKRPFTKLIWPLNLFIVAALFFSTQAHSANEDILVYTYLNGHHKDHSSDFRTIVRKSLNNLRKFSVSKNAHGRIPASKPLKKRLQAASKAGIRWVADVKFDTEKKKGKLTFLIYKTNGENIFLWTEKYKIRSMKAFLAQMEYSMPFKLKTKFLELGRIIKTDKRLVYFDLGETAGIKIGDTYQVYEEGDEIEDDDGNSYGYLEDTKGIIEVTQVTSVYSIAEIIIGQLSIDTGHWVKKTTQTSRDVFNGKILSVLENKLAINIGKNVGVEEGTYYAVFREIKDINGKESFRQPVGHIKVNEVFEDFSKGELSISDTYELTKYTIKKGDKVEEVESPRKNMWSVNQIMTNVNSDHGARIIYFTYQRDSLVNVNMVYRLKGGYGNATPFGAAGVMQSLGHSSHVFYGMDLMYMNDSALNLFISVDVDTPLSKSLKINLESGFILAHSDETYNGLNTSIGIKYAYDLF